MNEMQQIDRLQKRINLFSLTVVLIGIATGAAGAALSPFYWRWLGLLMATMIATFAAGAMVGFLFGIPRYRKTYLVTER